MLSRRGRSCAARDRGGVRRRVIAVARVGRRQAASPPPASAARSAIIDRSTARAPERTLVGPGLPGLVGSPSCRTDRTLLTGGADQRDPPLGRGRRASRSAQQSRWARRPIRWRPLRAIRARRCSGPASPATRCRADEGRIRAGPTLAGIFGRQIATPAGLRLLRRARESSTSCGRPETVCEDRSRSGPSAYTPGTKMPEQTIGPPRSARR